MVPERLLPAPEPVSDASWWRRGARAIFVERRLPYAISHRLQSTLRNLGFTTRERTDKNETVTVRRCTADEAFFENVLVDEEYFKHGYFPRDTDTVVDIGANIGCFVLAASRYVKRGRLVAIEPFPSNLDLLRRNVERNNLGNVEIVDGAIGAQNGSQTLFVGSDTGMHSLLFDTGRGSVDVATETLSDLFGRLGIEHCNFLKIDCEGAEFEFLPTIDAAVWKRIDRVVMEFSVPIPEWNFENPTQEHIARKLTFGDQLVTLLENNGFVIDAYVDCVGFRAGYIFAENSARQHALGEPDK
jgi:FkbM family methyltransferase